MNDYEVKSYSGLDEGAQTANNFGTQADTVQTDMDAAKTILSDQSIFMGPIQEGVIEELNNLKNDLTTLQTDFQTMGTYLTDASTRYKTGDQVANMTITGTSQSPKSTGGVVSTVNIPSSVNQAGYTVTCYGEGGWYLGGGSTPTAVASGTKQKSVHEAWLADGARYKNGIAVMNVNGQDHYLIATAPTLGSVGDSVDVNLENGETIPCVIADAKSTHDSNYTTYGHGRSDGSVNVLEFEVDRNKYNSSGNPSTNSWGLEWDSSSDVTSVDNYGTIV